MNLLPSTFGVVLSTCSVIGSRRSIDVVAVRVSRPDQYTYLYMYHYIRKFCGRFNRSDIQLLTLFSDLVVTLLHSIYPFLLPKIYDWFYTIDS